MSASNWAQCPKCHDKVADQWESESERLKMIYGSVDMHEFLDAKEKLGEKTKISEPVFGTFREDYEFYGAETGVLKIRYKGACSRCGLTHKFDTDEKFYRKRHG